MPLASERPIRFVQVANFYPAYLRDFYAARPELARAPFQIQIDALLDDGFSNVHLLTRPLTKRGWECQQIVANAAPAQRQWLQEQGLSLPEPLDTALCAAMQLQMLQPDIVYVLDVVAFDTRFMRKLPSRPRLILGWRGFEIPPGTDLSAFDAIVTSFDRIASDAPRFGARGIIRHYPGFPADYVPPEPGYDRDVVFSGSVTRLHATRVALLEAVWRASIGADGGSRFGFELFMPDVSMFPAEMQKRNRGSVWGNTMLRTLARSRVVINPAVDGLEQPPNMRVIEATGAGAFLLTTAHPDLPRFFTPGEELDTFTDAQELVAKIRRYVADEPERRRIAARGWQRCLRDYPLDRFVDEFQRAVTARLEGRP
jgi:hypothetical protein